VVILRAFVAGGAAAAAASVLVAGTTAPAAAVPTSTIAHVEDQAPEGCHGCSRSSATCRGPVAVLTTSSAACLWVAIRRCERLALKPNSNPSSTISHKVGCRRSGPATGERSSAEPTGSKAGFGLVRVQVEPRSTFVFLASRDPSRSTSDQHVRRSNSCRGRLGERSRRLGLRGRDRRHRR
jgi:hypothetical protein